MRKPRQYKAFDFVTGNTYLIGEFAYKSDAEAYCKTHGIVTIAQSLVPLTREEYIRAIANRKIDDLEDIERMMGNA